MDLSLSEKLMLQQFFAKKPVKKAYLFGSYARKTAVEGSDIDILVELDYTKHIGFNFVQMILDLEQILKKKVDLIPTDGVSKYMESFIGNDKVLIYERAA
jgi:predicted nucleotidyltransferase